MLTAKESNKAYATLPELSTIGITGVHVITIEHEKAFVIQTPNGTAVILNARTRYISEKSTSFDALKHVKQMSFVQLLGMGFMIH